MKRSLKNGNGPDWSSARFFNSMSINNVCPSCCLFVKKMICSFTGNSLILKCGDVEQNGDVLASSTN